MSMAFCSIQMVPAPAGVRDNERSSTGRPHVTDGPLIVQSDKTLLLEVDHDQAEACRRAIAPFAELERSPEHVHTYRLTPLGLWNVHASERGNVKQALVKLGWPAEDLAGYVDGEAHPISLAENGWALRNYQKEAADGFWHGGSGGGGPPLGAGKKFVGAAAMARAS